MQKGIGAVFIAFFLSFGLSAADVDLTIPQNLKVDGLSNPINIHRQSPSFSWHGNVKFQSHYQIQVATTSEALEQNKPDLWDSGKVLSAQSVHVKYQGKALASEQQLYWRVKVWAQEQNLDVGWSKTQTWRMGLLEKTDWQAKWIQVNGEHIAQTDDSLTQWIEFAANPRLKTNDKKQMVLSKLNEQATASLFRHQFLVTKSVVSAILYSTAAGYYEIFVNGQKVDDRLMDPGQTDYDQRILYNADDVLTLVEKGQNTLAVHLGSGWYNEEIAFSKPDSDLSYGKPKFIAQLKLTYDDGSTELITTNDQWLSHPSPVLKEGLFSGEYFDASKELSYWNTNTDASNLSKWNKVKVLSEWPTKSLEPQLLPPIRAVTELTPTKIFNPEPHVWVFDFGQNFTGIPTLNLTSLGLEPGQTAYLRYAEWVDNEGNINQKSGGAAPLLKQVDAYKAGANNASSWTPTFTWHGFRYIEIRGLNSKPSLDAISAHLVRSDVKRVGYFSSSDELINRIHDLALWSYEANLISVPMDCPIRERAGWTGDAHAALITGNYNFNMDNFWKKYLGDFKTSQHIAPAIVPGRRSHGGNFDWASAEVIIAWEHYRHHGDVQLLEQQYHSLVEYMEAATAKLEDSLLRIGYGDWCDPVREPGMPRVGGRCTPQQTPAVQTSSAFFAHTAELMASIAATLGKVDDESYYRKLHQKISKQFNKEFFNRHTNSYGSQTADAIALSFNMVPQTLRPAVAAAINKDVLDNWQGHASVGALGQTYLYKALSDFGYGETAFNIFKAEGYPGYSYLLDTLNATTLWESKGVYNPKADPTGKIGPGKSLNHPFHSGYDGWFYEGLGGIKPLKNAVGFQEFELNPVFVKQLSFVKVGYETDYGQIQSHWRRDGDKLVWEFSIPNNTKAWVSFPDQARRLYEAGRYQLTLQTHNGNDH
ncbi:family 78 glycoside hydrolase catalytic domain [Pseudomonadota bacterium]